MMKKAKTLANHFEELKNLHPEPIFHFENLPPSDRLEYEKLDWSNYQVILEMFADDDNPYIQGDYKDTEKLKHHARYVIEHGSFSPKHGQCDWLFKLKATGEYVGLLNLYELSQETFNNNHKKCMIGFLTRSEFRRKYYTREAVGTLINHAGTSLGRNQILANSEKDNEASSAFLKKLGFIDVNESYYYEDKYNYYKLDFQTVSATGRV